MKRFRILTLAALFAALFILVGTASADCPVDDPRCILLPPVSQEVGSTKSAGSVAAGSAEMSALAPFELVPMPPPPLASSPSRSTVLQAIPTFARIYLPMRFQDPSDPTCGVQALGMAMDGFSSSAPSSVAITDRLDKLGYLYSFGTGAEELAFTAREFGYAGSVAFHGWTLEQLRHELAQGRPVVLNLGANGAAQPGHFVTLTGLSDDWQWVALHDPLLGERTLSLDEFMRLWDMQGNSGVAVAQAPPPPESPDFAPWMALGAAMMASLALGPGFLTNQKRSGIGGSLQQDVPAAGEPLVVERPDDPPPPRKTVIVRAPYLETIVVGQKVVDRHLEKVARTIPARWETISPGHYEWQDTTVAYTAYRPKSVLVEKTVNVVREVTEKITTWVQETVVKPVTSWVKKTISRPVTTWVKKTSSWFERTWLGRWVRKTRTWFEKKVSWVRETIWEPVTRWVSEKVLQPVTSWVKRTVVEPVKKLVEEIVMMPYTAFKVEPVRVYVPPETRYIPAREEVYYEWVEETEPITKEVIRWRDVVVEAGALPGDVAEAFFTHVNPALSWQEQIALFNQFRDTFNAFITSDPTKVDALRDMAFEIFFNSISETENVAAMQNWKMTNAYTLSLRSEAGPNSAILRYIPYGSYIHWTTESQQIGETTWYKVQYYSNGKLVEGWVSSGYLTDYVPGSSSAMLDFQVDEIFEGHGVQLQGNWNLRDKRAAAVAIQAVAAKFAGVLGVEGEEAFSKILDELTLLWGVHPEAGGYLTPECKGITAGGCTSSSRMINFGTLWSTGPYRPEDIAFQASVNNVVHELGHAFANLWWGTEEGPYYELGHRVDPSLLSNDGFAPGPGGAGNLWRQHWEDSPTPNEVFADMFLGWTFEEWDNSVKIGDDRRSYMSENMEIWIKTCLYGVLE